jgi:Xaa-Pro dipeptidase
MSGLFAQDSSMKKDIIRKKINQMVPVALKEFNIDCWLTITRESAIDPISYDLCASSAVARMAILFYYEGSEFHKVAIAASYDITPLIESGIYDEVISYKNEGIKPHLLEILKKINPSKIAVNYSREQPLADGLTYGMMNYLVETLGEEYKNKFVSSEDIIVQYRSVKIKEEIELIEKAVLITQKILDECLSSQFIKPDITTEADLGNALEQKTLENGCTVAFTIVNVGASRGHSTPTERKIVAGDLIRIDFGVDYCGYKSDIQRTAYVLKDGETKVPERMQRMWDTVFKSNREGMKQLTAGKVGNDSDNIARKIIVDAGYPEYPHSAGHPIGFDVHDVGAILGPNWPERYGDKIFKKLIKGQTYAFEPTIYVYDEETGGELSIGLEEDVIITETEPIIIGEPQTEIYLIK